jgi:NADPH-dependent 2,4-dienoyl-CoA reductase/sulfur reductase-like enzyme
MAHLLIVGGSDAGISAALRARELAPSADVTVLVADHFPNYSVCGLPFFLSGEVSDWHTLAHRTLGQIESEGITVLLDHRAEQVDPVGKMVAAVARGGRCRSLSYDRLVIATGAVPNAPAFSARRLPGVFCLRSMRDAFVLHEYLGRFEPRSAVIVGSGYIGLEMADALSRAGLSVTVVVRSSVLRTVDPSLSDIVRDELSRNQVKVVDAGSVTGIEKDDSGGLSVRMGAQASVHGDLVLLATGIRPETALGETAGASLGVGGAIHVNRGMGTNVPSIYAAGDCAETWHRLLGRYTYLPLGTTAHKQGRVAGENAAGGHAEFAGSLGTQVVKIFELVVARTGLLHSEASEAGFDPFTVDLESPDHKAYYPGATSLRMRLTADRRTHAVLGAQLLGHYRAEVAKRADVVATAISGHMTVDDLLSLDLSYTPPLSSPWDPVQMCAHEWLQVLGGSGSPNMKS